MLVGAIGIAAGSLGTAGAWAGDSSPGALEEVIVTAEQRLTATAGSASEATVSAKELEQRPLLRPGDVNLDHGTDFATRVDGVPVNMPTHAHGQGYSDLNFLIPELVDRIEYKKGVYYAEEGDFSAAGAAEIHYRRSLDAPFAILSGGQEGYRRAVLAASAPLAGGDLLLAGQYGRTEGPWALTDGYHKAGGLLKYTRGDADRGCSFEAMGYDGHWGASDQIPLRAVTGGLISAFGTIDPTDGGKSHRWSVSGDTWRKLGPGELRAEAYAAVGSAARAFAIWARAPSVGTTRFVPDLRCSSMASPAIT